MPLISRLTSPPHRLVARLAAAVGALATALLATVVTATPALADYTGPYVPPGGTGPSSGGLGPASGGTLPGGVGPADGSTGLLPDTGSEITLWLVALALLLLVVGFTLLRRARRSAA